MAKIKIEAHPARQKVKKEDGSFELVECIHDVKMIRVNGIHAGYLDLGRDNAISMVRRYPEQILDEVREKAAKFTGKDAKKPSQPPAVVTDDEVESDDSD